MKQAVALFYATFLQEDGQTPIEHHARQWARTRMSIGGNVNYLRER